MLYNKPKFSKGEEMSGNSMLLYGKNSVFERLKARPETISKIFLRDNFEDKEILRLIQNKKIPVETLTTKELDNVKPGKDLQGIVAAVKEFGYSSFDGLIKDQGDSRLTIIFLDRLFDPHNLGVIMRTAACFGGFGIVIPKHNACEVTEAALHVASGGENYVPVCKVTNLSSAIIKAKDSGYWIMGGTVADDAQYLNEISVPFPLGLVLGSEGEGIRYGVEKHLDIKARIPMYGAGLSFNVAMASAIFCYEVSKQRAGIQ
ncbi:MAG: 23S rRNA (guanosine(2251)-2'-O)-methyltransferase RlmB [Candidatus Omnitrophica bacterium]|nr:23S rRNA (guanosine(2251)-2'-O)-methyltransferase RlmB [Candidatus Omnitrophota bacterium]